MPKLKYTELVEFDYWSARQINEHARKYDLDIPFCDGTMGDVIHLPKGTTFLMPSDAISKGQVVLPKYEIEGRLVKPLAQLIHGYLFQGYDYRWEAYFINSKIENKRTFWDSYGVGYLTLTQSQLDNFLEVAAARYGKPLEIAKPVVAAEPEKPQRKLVKR